MNMTDLDDIKCDVSLKRYFDTEWGWGYMKRSGKFSLKGYIRAQSSWVTRDCQTMIRKKSSPGREKSKCKCQGRNKLGLLDKQKSSYSGGIVIRTVGRKEVGSYGSRDLQASVKGQRGKVLGFADHMVSVLAANLWCENSHRWHVNQLVWLCSNKTLLTKTGMPDAVHRL